MLRIELRNRTLFFAYFSILFLLNSCITQKGGSGGSTGNLYEIFYVGEGINQYFIPGLNFRSKEKENIVCDFTYRDSSETVVCNFSIFSENPYSKFSEVFFLCNNQEFHLTDFNKIFIESRKRHFLSRFSSKLKIDEFLLLFEQKEISIIVNTPDSKSSFQATKKTMKSVERINSELIRILKLGRD
jgi:hypothetical protein